jgi:hypothetical protein
MHINKIEKYQVEERVLALSAQGLTGRKIAEQISLELTDKGIVDSISHTAVTRFLVAMRKERSEKTRSVVLEHIQAVVPQDMVALEEIERELLTWFRDPNATKDKRATFGMQALKVIETKLRYAGILEIPEQSVQGGNALDPINMDSFKSELRKVQEGVSGAH